MPVLGKSQYYSAFSPQAIPGCALWLDAADTTSLTLSGSNVTGWRDKSGTGRTVTISNTCTYTSATPSVNTSIANGSRIVVNTDLRKSVVKDVNIFIVYAWSGFSVAGSSNQFLWGQDIGGGWNRIQFLSYPAATSFAYGLGYQVADPYRVIVSNMATSNRLIYNATFSYLTTNATFAYINGTLSSGVVTEGAAGPETTSSNVVFGAGNTDAGAPIANVEFNEIIILSNAITPAQRQTIEGYLANKWNLRASIPTTHPYKTLAPFARPFIPADISGCALWLDGLDPSGTGIAPAYGSTISRWVDKSGLSNSTSAVSGSITYVSNAVNSRPALSFSNTYFTGTFATAYTGSNIQAFAVGVMNSASGQYARMLSLGQPGSNDYNTTSATYMFLRPGGTSQLQIGRNSSYATVDLDGYDIPFMAQAAHNVTVESIAVNGADPTTQDTGVTAGFNITGYGIGTHTNTTDGSSRWNGYIGEVIYYTTTLSTKQRQQVETYLANKWGLRGSTPSGHYARLAPALSTPFNPLLLSSCAMWLDATDATSLTMSGTNVVRWNDKSGNTRHAVSTGNPQMGTTTTGRPAVVLSGANYFDVSGASTLSGGSSTVFIQASATTNSRNLYNLWNNSRSLTFQLYYNGTNNLFFTANTLFFNSNAMCCIIDDTTSTVCSSFFNGRADNTMTAVAATPNSTFVLGANSGGTNGWIGNIQEMIYYNRALPRAERQQVEGYLAGKWGLMPTLPAAHPYKAATP